MARRSSLLFLAATLRFGVALTWGGGSHVEASEVPTSEGVVVNSIGMRMVLVPAGTFTMGSPAGVPMRQEDEFPRRVTLTRAFRIASTEVTQRQWLVLMPKDRSPQQGPDLPVTSISWPEAREFCRKLSQRERATCRLPTEAEWEYACRAGSSDPPSRAVELAAVAWSADDSEGTTHPVGLKEPNAWGLFDTLGNVAEWTLDSYAPYPRVEQETDPAGPTVGSVRVVRGGAWRSFPPALRCAARVGTPESYQLPHVGLRVVQEIESIVTSGAAADHPLAPASR